MSFQASLAHAWRVDDAQCSAYALTQIAGMLAAHGRWREAAWLFGATEAFCETIGLAFWGDIWQVARAFGLPQPWQGSEAFTGKAVGLRATVLKCASPPLPPLPDPAAAAALWEAGKRLPVADAVAHALAVELVSPPTTEVMRSIARMLDGVRPAVVLTPREQEVLVMLCQRLTNAEMAQQLFLSHRTVEDHVDRLLGKLGAANRRQAAAAAARLGLIAHDPQA